MATRGDWADAYLAQARADLRGARAVAAAGEPSVLAMLLQMAFEKFAKAALLRSAQIAAEDARALNFATLLGERFEQIFPP